MKRIIGVLFLVLLLTGCDQNLVTGFKIGFAASRPFVLSMVNSGVLTQEKADLAVKDIGDGVDAASHCEACIHAITESGSAKKVGQAKCYFALAQDLRAMLQRHNLAGNPKLDQIAVIAQGAIDAFEAYYHSVSPPIGATEGAAPKDAAEAEKQLKTTVESLHKQLKDVTGGEQ